MYMYVYIIPKYLYAYIISCCYNLSPVRAYNAFHIHCPSPD